MREVSGWGLSGPAGGDARYHLVITVEQFATPQLRTWLESRVSSVQADMWREIGERLGRLGHWEFEDYQPRYPVSGDESPCALMGMVTRIAASSRFRHEPKKRCPWPLV